MNNFYFIALTSLKILTVDPSGIIDSPLAALKPLSFFKKIHNFSYFRDITTIPTKKCKFGFLSGANIEQVIVAILVWESL